MRNFHVCNRTVTFPCNNTTRTDAIKALLKLTITGKYMRTLILCSAFLLAGCGMGSASDDWTRTINAWCDSGLACGQTQTANNETASAPAAAASYQPVAMMPLRR
jgi:hypothetical protein